MDGVWLGAPGLADGSGLEFGGAAVFARTLLSLTHQVTTLPLPAPSSPASHQRMFYSFRLSRELPAPYLLLEPKFIAALNHPQCLHNASPPAPTLAASFFELTIYNHLCTFLQSNRQGANGISDTFGIFFCLFVCFGQAIPISIEARTPSSPYPSE